eukprot:CAMPEP_0168317142 /NCGR_PEP_ID=MMETSP0210-20121227/22922_1 /TAXON_ID=40633 /ORGANISM="Condylostoma magnum, Strain COL2" /LENGTH=42 /DNA_ID= /DNA_START= /DNA_END= /DNA_ORIENTATION=
MTQIRARMMMESDSNSGSIVSGATSGTHGTLDSLKSVFISSE